MSPQAQRIAIAEACGWKYAGRVNDRLLMWPPAPGDWQHPPDYPNDLNAMHEARTIAITNMFDVQAFERILGELCNGYRNAIHATAEQRAQAFLRTLGKWEDAS
jgi:hypothetical protein